MLKKDTYAKPIGQEPSKANILIQKIGEFKDIIIEIEEFIRDYHTEKMINADEFEDFLSEFNRIYKIIMDEMKAILFSLREQ
jgi:hypothetical protein